MCLRLTSYEKKIAQEDIVCYKVLRKKEHKEMFLTVR